VPTDKITSRYFRSLDLLSEAIKHTNRAYIFDNSGSDLLWLAEITEDQSVEIKSQNTTAWFKKYVLDKME
jgi:predicted ABC-type ATPase